MKVLINNRGPGEVKRLALEPSKTQGLVDLRIFKADYDRTRPDWKILADVTVSAPELKAAIDSLINVCKKSRG